jgi:hypothetical protein
MNLEEMERDGSETVRLDQTYGVQEPPASTTGERRRRFKLFSMDDVLDEPSPEWRVEGLLPVGGLSMIYAPQAQFKTFFGLDIALSVAHGIDFHERRVKRGPTVYVLGEGRGGLKNRIRGWLQERRIDVVEEAFFVLEAVQFKRPEDVAALRTQIDALNIKPAMLFIDTFARSAVGLDENDATQVGLWIDAITTLQHDMKIDIVAIHHAQKGNGLAVRERGSSAFVGAVDTVIRLLRKTPKSKVITISCDKQKDAEEFQAFSLGVKVVSLGMNEHGEPTSSCVLVDPENVDVEIGLSRQQCVMLQTLAGFPEGTAERQQLLLQTKFEERTLDRYRQELSTAGYIESIRRGVFRITADGLAAIANKLPIDGHGDPALDVAATPHTPVRGGVATGLATVGEEPQSGPNEGDEG